MHEETVALVEALRDCLNRYHGVVEVIVRALLSLLQRTENVLQLAQRDKKAFLRVRTDEDVEKDGQHVEKSWVMDYLMRRNNSLDAIRKELREELVSPLSGTASRTTPAGRAGGPHHGDARRTPPDGKNSTSSSSAGAPGRAPAHPLFVSLEKLTGCLVDAGVVENMLLGRGGNSLKEGDLLRELGGLGLRFLECVERVVPLAVDEKIIFTRSDTEEMGLANERVAEVHAALNEALARWSEELKVVEE